MRSVIASRSIDVASRTTWSYFFSISQRLNHKKDRGTLDNPFGTCYIVYRFKETSHDELSYRDPSLPRLGVG